MSKELLRPSQFGKATYQEDIALSLNEQQSKELQDLFEGALNQFIPGKPLQGNVVKIDSDGVLIDINYKSDGIIPKYEFSRHELEKLQPGATIEVLLDELENSEGNVVLSYEKAKALRAWDSIIKLHEEDKPVQGTVTHKVKGGLSVDIGIPAFLPGSQIDIQRVTDFDHFVGQTITANIIKVNKKRGNVIISRRKFLNEQRSEARQQVLETLAEGQVIQGIVKNITNYGVFIDIGGVDGLLHITDMTWGRIAHPSEMVKIGDKITIKVLSFDKANEKISLGLKQLTDNPWERAESELKVGTRVHGTISSITDYGLFVELEKGVEGLVHISEISWTDRISDLHKKFKVGDKVDVLIVSLDKEHRRMSLSIKQLEQNPWESITQQFQVGQKITGTISNITDFGIFVQLIPGVDGLVHISDLSWTQHIAHPSDRYKKSDSVEALILTIDEKNKKISLGIKQLEQDPWSDIAKEYPEGKIVEGEISKITNFGAFVKLPSGVEGLLHISEFADQNVEKLEDILKIGQKETLRVINVNPQERKLGLSLKLEGPIVKPAEKPSKDEAKKEKAAEPAHKEVVQMQSAANKGKSQLQIELEKHTARQQDENSSTDDDSSTEK